MRLHRVPWRNFQRAPSLEALMALARAGIFGRISIARDAQVAYAKPALLAGNTEAAQQFLRPFLGSGTYWVPEIDVVALPGCIFATRHSLPVFKGCMVCDELDYRSDTTSMPHYFDLRDGALKFNAYMQEELRKAAWGPAATLIVHPRFHSNYTHWHTEALTQLDTLRVLTPHIDAIAVPPLGGYKRPSLDLFGDPGRPLIELTAPVHRFAVGLLLTHSLFRTWLHPASERALRRLRAAGHERHGDLSARRRPVYLSRQDSKFRPMANEAALCEALAARGFEVIVASQLDFREQVRAFSRASIIVSPHGSGLTNMVYAPQGTPVVELRPLHAKGRSPFYDRSYWILATLLGMPYAALVVENAPDTDEWEVDLPWALERIAGLVPR